MNPAESNRQFRGGGGAVRPRTCPAFTLLELLVVMAILGLMASLLLPAMGRARAQARRVECLARQKQWAAALQMHVDDHENWLPRESQRQDGQVFRENWAQIQDPQGGDVWYNALPREYLQVKPAAAYARPEAKLPFFQGPSLFHCAGTRFPALARSPRFQFALFSIALNSQLIEAPRVPTARLVSGADSSRLVLFLDNLLDDEDTVVPQQAQTDLGQPAAFANRFAGRRHGRGGNLVFHDGHAETIAGEQVVETRGPLAGWDIVPATRIVWELE